MGQPSATPEERFTAVVEAFREAPGVMLPADEGESKRGFGSSELRIHKKIFAMLVRRRLVVKLPKARVEALVAAGAGERFDPRRDGRLMREWLMLDSASEEDWLALAREALRFVAGE